MQVGRAQPRPMKPGDESVANTSVTELGYIGIGVEDVDAWRFFASEILGMENFDESGNVKLRTDQWHHRIIMHSGRQNDMLYAGFRVAGPDEFQLMRRHLSECGVSFEIASADEAKERCVLEYLRLSDPAGVPLEIFHGPQIDRHKPLRPGRGMHGKFCMGSGGLGHIIIREAGVEASYRFYSEVLGMRGSVEAQVNVGSEVIHPVFMHCNDRDHSVAFGAGPVDKRIQHLMLEVDNIDDVGLAYDLVKRHKVPLVLTLGRHSNDNMISFYVKTPSGWLIEYGYGGSPAKHQSEYIVGEVWGHEFLGHS
jgi:2,3-dihydroxyethylbenzene 1,2-dioxygenase